MEERSPTPASKLAGDPGSGRPASQVRWPGTPVGHTTDEDLSAGTPVVHPTDEDLSAGTPVRPPHGRRPVRGDPGSRLRAMLPSQNRELGHPVAEMVLWIWEPYVIYC